MHRGGTDDDGEYESCDQANRECEDREPCPGPSGCFPKFCFFHFFSPLCPASHRAMAAMNGLGNSIGVLVSLGFEKYCEIVGLPVLVV